MNTYTHWLAGWLASWVAEGIRKSNRRKQIAISAMDTAYRCAPRSIFIIMFTTAEQLLVRRILKCLSLKTCVCVCPRKLRNLFRATSVARAMQWQRAGYFFFRSGCKLVASTFACTSHPARNMVRNFLPSLYICFQRVQHHIDLPRLRRPTLISIVVFIC